MKSKQSYSLHDKGTTVVKLSTHKKPNSIPKNYGHAMNHFPVIGQKFSPGVDGKLILVPIIGHGAPLSFRRIFTQPPVFWPHLRTEKKLALLRLQMKKDKDGNDILRYPEMIATLEKQCAREKVGYDTFKAEQHAKHMAEHPVSENGDPSDNST